jgi:tape measure domain-containing protein
MSTNVGSIDYKLKLDTTAFDAQALAVKGKLAGIGNSINAGSKDVDGFGTKGGMAFGGIAAKAGIAALAVAGVGLAAKAITTPFVNAASEAQNLRTQLDVLTGSSENGAKMYKSLVDMAERTPFESADLTAATSTMLAFGVSSEKVLPVLSQLGDISMGNKDRFAGLSLAFGQVSATGRLMGQDLLQMVNAGFNPLEIISKKTGRSMIDLKKDMEEGKISVAMVEDAMKTATAQGGRFFGGMDKASKTYSGRMSTLADSTKTAMRSIMGIDAEGNIKAGGLFDRLSKSLEKLFPIMEKIGKNAGPAIERGLKAVDKALVKLQPVFAAITKEIKLFWEENQDWLIPALKMLAMLVGGAVAVSLGLLLGLLYAGFKAFNLLQDAIEWTIIQVIRIYEWFTKLEFSLKGIVSNIMNWLYQAGKDLIVGFINGMVSMVGWVWNALVSIQHTIWNFYGGVWGWLYGHGVAVIQGFANGIRAAAGAVWWAIKAAADQIGGFFGGAWNWLYGVGRAIVDGLVRGMRDMIWSVQNVAGSVGGAVTSKLKSVLGIRSPSKVMYGFGTNITQGLANGINSGMDKVEAMASNMAVQVKAPMVSPDAMGGRGNVSSSTYSFGDIHIADKQTADYFFGQLNRNGELARKGLTTL